MSLTFKLRDGEVVVAKDYFDRYLNFDWFIAGLVRFDKDNYNEHDNEHDNDNDNEHDIYELWEDKLVVLSIFDSIKFQKLTVHKGVSLDYLENLCGMWLAPEWIITDVIQRKKEVKVEELELKESIEKIHKCMNCSVGFKLSDNHKTACKSHRLYMSPTSRLFNCCGRDVNGEPCLIGYHIPAENEN